MKLHKESEGEFTLRLTEEQLLVMFGCMRESFASLDQREFQSRIGAPTAVVSDIAQELMQLMESVGIDQ